MNGANLIVFRDTSRQASGRDLCSQLRESVFQYLHTKSENKLIDSLLLAGQIESGLRDCDSLGGENAERITNWLAARLVASPRNESEMLALLAELDCSAIPDQVRISPAEGFAYYALHPADFADAAMEFTHGGSIAVIGIRSIGTVLSAVAIAAFERKGRPAERITVRPKGHPYSRTLSFSLAQKMWVEEQNRLGSRFVIVDEGPGLSGSSFLATAEALVAAGVSHTQITLMGTRDVDARQLCAPSAAERWNEFGWRSVPSRIWREYANWANLSGGNWREILLRETSDWPSCWPEMERLKFLSPDRAWLHKFEGLGDSGAQARERSCAIYKAGFGTACENGGNGMSAYHFVDGRPLRRSDCSPAIVERIAEYCAFRAGEFKVSSPENDANNIEQATRFNFHQEFGRELELSPGSLQSGKAVIVDGRLQPPEWIAKSNGTVTKVDAALHGDDHFMPGPADLAWDLAGAVVEWDLDRDGEEFLLNKFRARTGVDVTPQFKNFLLAYAVFRMSFSKMAKTATQSEQDKRRLSQAYKAYRRRISRVFPDLCEQDT